MDEIDVMHAQSDAEILVATMQPNIFTPGQEVAQVRRLHVNMCHPSKERLIADIKKVQNAWTEKIKEAVDEVYSHCTIKKFREKGN